MLVLPDWPHSMYRIAIFLVLLALTSLASGGARADVVYDWVNLEPNNGPDHITVQASLAINDADWSFGGTLKSTTQLGCCGATPEVIPYFGLDRISVTAESDGPICSVFGTAGCLGVTETGPIPCTIYYCPDAPDTSVFGDTQFASQNSFDLTTGLFLTGSINLFTIDTGVSMRSDGIFWTVTEAGADPALCNNIEPDGCAGEVGVWILNPASLPVPEPAPLALFGLGVAGLGFPRRRKTN